MKILISIIALFVLTNALSALNLTNQTDFHLEWQQWKKAFNKTYSETTSSSTLPNLNRLFKKTDVERKKFETFKENLVKINLHNSLNHLFEMAPNAFTDLTTNELNARFHISIDMAKLISYHNKIGKIYVNSTSILPEYIDWAKSGYMAPIDDQGVCGSCYTFATASAIEGAYAIKMNLKNKVINLSEQQLLDCSYFTSGFSNLGCNGGFAYPTLLYVFNNGIEQEKSYPYVGTRKTCSYDSAKVITKITNINSIEFGNCQAMKEALNKQPIIAHMYVPPDFYHYRSGIYSSPLCPPNCASGINHMVTIVGYGVDTRNISYWLVRNHWGTSWGESGYFKIIMGRNMCCIEGFEYFPVI